MLTRSLTAHGPLARLQVMKRTLATLIILTAMALPGLAEQPSQSHEVGAAHCNGRVLPEQLSAVPAQPEVVVQATPQKQELRVVKLDPMPGAQPVASTASNR
jgi:hypothetical protein